MIEEVVSQMSNFAGAGIVLGGVLGFIVIIIDYVFTSIMSLMKGR